MGVEIPGQILESEDSRVGGPDMLVARRWAKGGRDTAYLRATGVLGSCAHIIGHSLGQRAMCCTLANVRLFCWIKDDL